jgi:serine/threonine-protein phosphatase 2A regulatory subunit A
MEEDDHSLHPIQILIDELKNDDLELRLNSMRSLGKIAEALGQERTRSELVPFLTVSAIDDEDEVLVVLAEQLGSFPKYVGEEHSHILVPPLEQLSTLEDSNVREQVYFGKPRDLRWSYCSPLPFEIQAVKSLTLICNVLSPESCVSYLLPVVEHLALGEWFTNRVSACTLFPVLLTKLPAAFHEKIFTFVIFCR